MAEKPKAKARGVGFAETAEVFGEDPRNAAQSRLKPVIRQDEAGHDSDNEDEPDNEITRQRKGLRRKPTVKGTYEVIDAGL